MVLAGSGRVRLLWIHFAPAYTDRALPVTSEPAALYIPAEDLAHRHTEIPRDREIALYCTCPDEVTSAQEALRLRARGLSRVRPLKGGLAAWRARHFPVEFMGPAVPPDERILNAA